MKVLIFSLAYLPFIGGAEVAIKEITDRIGDIEFDLLTVNLDGKQKNQERIGNINVYRLGKNKLAKYFFPWTAYEKAKELNQEKKYDAIWAMMANQAGLATLFFKWKFPAVKYLLTLQEGDSNRSIWLRTWFMRPLYKAIYRQADYIQAISNFLAQRAKQLGVKCPVEVVPNGIILPADQVSSQKIGSYVISVSRLTKKNGLEDLVKAMQFVPGKQLKLVGDGELKEKLKKLTANLGLQDRVEFVGQVDYRLVYDYLRNASVFVRPSLSEGLGNAFLEAMAVNTPVIATPVGGIPDFLIDGQTGWFCKVRNPESIAKKINYILDPQNANEVNRVVEDAYQMVRQKYRWDLIASQMKEIFSHL
ncbi:MAG: glycosyltransferase family 4 protein [Candidatus Buchananbacteria bacterium]|nr:glycosyltransferase family 4 protein [Candidatus Buchananbacteria bacterium]